MTDRKNGRGAEETLKLAINNRIKDLRYNQELIGGVFFIVLPTSMIIKGICQKTSLMIAIVTQSSSSVFENSRSKEVATLHLAQLEITVMTESDWKSVAQNRCIVLGSKYLPRTKSY